MPTLFLINCVYAKVVGVYKIEKLGLRLFNSSKIRNSSVCLLKTQYI